ncbi:hypothetical protein [Colwellia sp.]|nr:hypothetical protein [Colwellia sp.]
MIDKKSDNWKTLPLLLKCWFVFNFYKPDPVENQPIELKLLAI